jgi:hypothetical protein
MIFVNWQCLIDGEWGIIIELDRGLFQVVSTYISTSNGGLLAYWS